MARAHKPSFNNDTTDAEGSSCTESIVSAVTAFQTDTASPLLSPYRHRPGSDMGILDLYGPGHTTRNPEDESPGVHETLMYGGVYVKDDVVGQYLARRDAQIASMEAIQAPIPHCVSLPAGYSTRGHQTHLPYDSHANGSAQRWYPDPETIRQLHALHSLLPHISPERKLNALSGLEIDIIDGNTNQVLYKAAPKKLLVLFLGREVVNKFIRTFAREDNEGWRGLPTEQKLVLPSKATSAAALKILVSWMKRACTFTTMKSMKPLQIPNNLFVACSLARTLEMFRLHRDAYRLDVAIAQQFSSRRPIFAVEIETMWMCLGENDKYVYACIRALVQRISDPRVAENLQVLAERFPTLYARLRIHGLNELYRPQFGRKWFETMDGQSNEFSLVGRERRADDITATRPALPPNNRPDFTTETSNQAPQGTSLLNPSASPFAPSGEQE